MRRTKPTILHSTIPMVTPTLNDVPMDMLMLLMFVLALLLLLLPSVGVEVDAAPVWAVDLVISAEPVGVTTRVWLPVAFTDVVDLLNV